jgi:hypothetical protein
MESPEQLALDHAADWMITHSVSNSAHALDDNGEVAVAKPERLRTAGREDEAPKSIQISLQIVSSETGGASFNLSQRIYIAGFSPI